METGNLPAARPNVFKRVLCSGDAENRLPDTEGNGNWIAAAWKVAAEHPVAVIFWGWLYSVITEIELFSAPHLTEDAAEIIRTFLARCHRVDLTPDIAQRAIDIRRRHRLRTPDAIIAASALSLNVTLLTADKRLERIPGLKTISEIL